MLVMTHGPETCPAVHPEYGEKARQAAGRLDEIAARLGITPQGWWLDPVGHAQFLLLDASDAHAATQLARELALFHWNTVDIRPLVTLENGIPFFAR